jgi:hypothetical protein
MNDKYSRRLERLGQYFVDGVVSGKHVEERFVIFVLGHLETFVVIRMGDLSRKRLAQCLSSACLSKRFKGQLVRDGRRATVSSPKK